jgi:hypothetical protein
VLFNWGVTVEIELSIGVGKPLDGCSCRADSLRKQGTSFTEDHMQEKNIAVFVDGNIEISEPRPPRFSVAPVLEALKEPRYTS